MILTKIILQQQENLDKNALQIFSNTLLRIYNNFRHIKTGHKEIYE